MAAMRDKPKTIFTSIDWFTILLYLLLLAFGWMSICGACYEYGEPKDILSLASLGTRTGMQLVWIGSSMVLGAVILMLDDRIFDTFAYFIYAALLLLLLATPFLAHDIKGSMSWIKIGSFSLQPAEFAKFATALVLAKFMSGYGFRLEGSWRNMAICMALIVAPMALIVLQKETGSALVYFSLLLMLYREGMPGSVLFTGISAVTYVVVGLRFADVMVLSGTTSLGVLLVMLLIVVFVAGLIFAYARPSVLQRENAGESRAAAHTYRLALISTLGLALGGMAFVVGVAHFWFPRVQPMSWLPFDVAPLLVVICGALILRLLWIGLSSHIYRYVYIALFAFGSMAVFFSAHTLVDHLAPHQRTRVMVLLGLEEDPNGVGYNQIQSKIAIGSGGLEGKGFLNGTQTKLKYVPEQETDFIFCTVGEEQGFIGSAAVLVLFLLLLLRLIYLAERQPYAFGRVYGYCVFSVFFFHVLINIGMVLGLMPVIGIPLPFFSYGGSSLWGFTLLLFIFLRIDAGRIRMQR
ncbi:MAG: rod shape-determining protein RodA [Bacteroidaceae bacterium]|nr:rod shape-determining protein RodA [Bacteroidaceae bacterium]